MRKSLLAVASALFATVTLAQNQAPQLTNVQVNVPWQANTLTLTYDLSDAEGDAAEVRLLVSNNGGLSYLVNVGTMSGDVGSNITAGTNKQIVWNFDTISNIYAYSLRLVADDGQVPDVQSLVDQVDSVRLYNDLTFIAGVRHYQTNPVHLEAVKDSIESRFVAAGLQTRRQAFQRANYTGHNVIGRKPGFGDEALTYIIDAHFDGVSNAPAADDNGSGVVGVLEALRILQNYNFKRSINFIGFDFEETVGLSGTYGSQMYVQNGGRYPWESIQGVINLECIGYYSNEPNSQSVPTGFGTLFPQQVADLEADGYRGNFIVNTGDTESTEFTNALTSIAGNYVPELKVTTLIVPFNGSIAPDLRRSDHAHFWDVDIPAVMLTDGANLRNPNYHTPNDTIGSINFTFAHNVVKACVATLAELAQLQNSTHVDVDILGAGVGQVDRSCSFQVAPNPSMGEFRVTTGACFSDRAMVTLHSVDGKLVSRGTRRSASAGQINMCFADVPCGIYLLKVEEAGRSALKKVVIG